jgi:peroxiredoxin Q/BCP
MNRLRSVRYLLIGVLFAWLSSTAIAAEPQIGSAAPAFKLQDQDGKWHDLKDYRGKWIALYFYPKDQTPGCTDQACEFTQNVFAYRDAGAVILGVSVDDVASHKKFEAILNKQRLKDRTVKTLPFPLLADPTKQTAKAYGVLVSLLGMEYAQRDTFLIDPQGRIAK